METDVASVLLYVGMEVSDKDADSAKSIRSDKSKAPTTRAASFIGTSVSQASIAVTRVRKRERVAAAFRLGLYLFPFSSGFLSPVTGALNVKASETVGSIFFVVAIVYSVITVISVSHIWLTSKQTLRQNWLDVGDFVLSKPAFRWICLTGGIMGVAQNVIYTMVADQGGTGIYSLGQLVGSIFFGMFIDATGILWAPRTPLNWYIITGSLMVVAGAILHSLSVMLTNQEASMKRQIMLVLVSALSGVSLCIQACGGNKLADLTGEFRRALCWSFMSGSVLMWFIGPYAAPNPNLKEILTPRNWWQLAQTPIVAYNLAVIALSQLHMTAAMVYCWFVVGQLTSSSIADSIGFLGLTTRPMDAYKYSGLGIVFIGVALVTLSKIHKERLQVKESVSMIASVYSAASLHGSSASLRIPTASDVSSLLANHDSGGSRDT
eukprot:Gregarina_sp_Poly_1__3726@NODE_20_length_21312_cov_69_583714_g18_i0_p5_GENE_NODE_20_length_21312_cov_69_583714_g18_i0NODE_20_length_21312_cov_69_583714_g18_i0_p5_ORF_typecomplete_len436_score42_37DMT_YdcZ/PF04657_13/5_3e15DMT_YdcZ/PF04657_13/2_1e13Phage_holin_8/PF16931_5/32Phage_holin_8/PF16931_5/0_034Phage_holin_8/PF16931_5/4_2e03YrhK/PF14145_6/1_8e03YrhK/PF14145_6/21YrhK/PF14145_6/35YrhK/PF14145_6/3DUF2109/PF09882_9/4_7e03DUF2109/PF09882_9/57DUF2109/PF09882_9/5_3DUF202/PF02656_15/20DUF202/PF02